MNQRSGRPARHFAGVAMLLLVGAAIGYLALMPNVRGNMLGFLPQKVRRWIVEHDDLNNVVAFAVLGSVAFRIGRKEAARFAHGISGVLGRVFARRETRLAALMALVVVLELFQLVIPGRISGLRDVCTGWSGLFAAWLISEATLAKRIRDPGENRGQPRSPA